MRKPASTLGAAAATLVVACASLSGGAYKASSLRFLVSSQLARQEEQGFTLLAARLRSEEEVVRVLGPRSGWLARSAVVVQIAVMTGDATVRLAPDSLRLLLPAGRAVEPAEPERVLGAVSLPDDYWKRRPGERRVEPVAKPLSPGDQPDYSASPEMAYAGLTLTAIELAVRAAGAETYRQQARADVVGKTALPREVAPGSRLDLLLVFMPPAGAVARGGPVRLVAEIDAAGRRVERTLQLD